MDSSSPLITTNQKSQWYSHDQSSLRSKPDLPPLFTCDAKDYTGDDDSMLIGNFPNMHSQPPSKPSISMRRLARATQQPAQEDAEDTFKEENSDGFGFMVVVNAMMRDSMPI